MVFCSCGCLLDLSNERCAECGIKISQEAIDAATTPLGVKKSDRWKKKYCTPPSSASSSRYSTPTGTIARSTPINLRPSPSRASTAPSPSSLDKSLPPLPSSSSSQPPLRANSSSPSTYKPLVQTNTGSSVGSLQKVFGSLLEKRPDESRCLHCDVAFEAVAGAKGRLFPAPGHPDPTRSDARFLCLPCFTEENNKGNCQACKLPVAGIKGDAAMSSRDQVWHDRCFRCTSCTGKATLLSLDSLPICETCFFPPADAPTVEPRAQRANPSFVSSRPRANLGGLATTLTHSFNAHSRPRSAFTPSSSTNTPSTNSRAGPSVTDLASRFTYAPPTKTAEPPRRPLQSPSTRKLEIRDQPSAHTRSSFLRESKKTSAASTRPATMYDLILPRSSSDLSSFSSDGDGGAESDATSGGTFSDVWASKEEGLDQIANGGRKLENGRRELELEDLMMEVERGCRLADEDSPNAARVIATDDLSSTIRPKPKTSRAQQPPVAQPRKISIARKPVPILTSPRAAPLTVATTNSKPSASLRSLPFTGGGNLDRAFPSASSPASNLYAKRKTLPKLGGMTLCQGCDTSVGAMETGVIPGPSASRWHKRCLTCGGGEGRGPQVLRLKGNSIVGCGRQLDTDAKVDSLGGVWCRACVDTSRRSARPLSVALTGNILLSSSTTRAPTPNASYARPTSMYQTSALSRSMAPPPPPNSSHSGLSYSTRTPSLATSTRTNPTTALVLPTSGLSRSTSTRPITPAPSNPAVSHLREQTRVPTPRPRSILSPTNFSEDPRPLTHTRTGSPSSFSSLSQQHTGSSTSAASGTSGHARKGSLKFSAARVVGWRDERWGEPQQPAKMVAVAPEPVEAPKTKRVAFESTGGGLVKRGSILARSGVRSTGRGGAA